MKRFTNFALILTAAALLLTPSFSAATITMVGENQFPANSLFIDFTGYNGSQVNKLVIQGVTFDYTYHTADRAYIGNDGGDTNHIYTPALDVTVDQWNGWVSMDLPQLQTMVGFGWDAYEQGIVNNAGTVSLFNGTTSVGSINFGGASDPFFTGGYVGLLSSDPFNRVEVTIGALGWSIDNISFATPEPCSLLLMGSGVLGLGGILRRRI